MMPTEFDKGWVVGFIENKGAFTVNKIKILKKTKNGVKKYTYNNPAFYVVSRDRSPLEIVKNTLGMGKIRHYNDIFQLEIRKKSELLRLVGFLDGKLRSEKSKRFDVWKKRVLEWKIRAWGVGAE
ncbi:MAG: hypothetical protein DRN83_03520 [Hadesarchaea archaeon]|nr:MAG: hypothetical protein DRN83_03520 [Hadesarchaea archaeon]